LEGGDPAPQKGRIKMEVTHRGSPIGVICRSANFEKDQKYKRGNTIGKDQQKENDEGLRNQEEGRGQVMREEE